MKWIDLALIGDETALNAAFAGMTIEQLNGALQDVADALEVGETDLLRGALRILIERARPLALPTDLWRRPITASTDARAMVVNHFGARGIEATPRRIESALAMYARFEQERDRTLRLREAHLVSANYHCAHCGLRFHNEELLSRTLVSPLGNRRRPPNDRLKPHWNGDAGLREPTLDHDWPVSLYGDNGAENLRVLCHGCNLGKEQAVALEHLRPWVGLPGRADLLLSTPVSVAVFYAQLRREPHCYTTGKTAFDTELTVQPKRPSEPAVLDNLRTVAIE